MVAKCTTPILKRLREVMKNTSYVSQSLQAYVIPSCDAHQSEYVASCDKRREYVTGFSGSFGTAIVTEQHAALWTDGRYYLQAEQQLDENWSLMKDGIRTTLSESRWLAKVLPVGSRVGVDPFLISYDAWRNLSKELKAEGLNLVPVRQNLIDIIRDETPSPPFNIVEALSFDYTGQTWIEKIISLRQKMVENRAAILVVTALDDVAWLFNLRGSDIEYNPVFFSYAVLTMKSVHLCIDEKKLTPVIMKSLQQGDALNLQVHPYEDITEVLSLLITDNDEGKVWISGKSSYALVSLVPRERRFMKGSPVAAKKAIKNEQEVSCARKAHVKDAVALCQFFCWLSHEVPEGNITEISAAEKLESFRKMQDNYVGPSFETISAFGPNGSVVHYRPEAQTNRKVTTEAIYLCDSGGQYRDGTTDVTRTVHFGIPSSFEKICYTLVLKGHIALATAIFPKLIKGQLLDSFARKPLWESGLDYMHGTGHGVGAYLNVHEGPIGVSYRHHHDDPGMQPGMILSIEPGYYEDGQFGIRLENLAVVKKAKTPHNFKDRDYLTFDYLTLVPFQTKLIEPSLLTAEEIKWLNDYHNSCREIVGKALEEQGKDDALQWLLRETLPLG